MFEPIPISEFGEEMQDLASQLDELVRAAAAEADAAVREFSRCAAPALRERKPRRMHPKHRPPRTREGFPWRLVVPQL